MREPKNLDDPEDPGREIPWETPRERGKIDCDVCGKGVARASGPRAGVSETASVVWFAAEATPTDVRALYVVCGETCRSKAPAAQSGALGWYGTTPLGRFTGARSTSALVWMLRRGDFAPPALARLLRLALGAERAPTDRRRFDGDAPHVEVQRAKYAGRDEKKMRDREREEAAQAVADEWNRRNPPGTSVIVLAREDEPENWWWGETEQFGLEGHVGVRSAWVDRFTPVVQVVAPGARDAALARGDNPNLVVATVLLDAVVVAERTPGLSPRDAVAALRKKERRSKAPLRLVRGPGPERV